MSNTFLKISFQFTCFPFNANHFDIVETYFVSKKVEKKNHEVCSAEWFQLCSSDGAGGHTSFLLLPFLSCCCCCCCCCCCLALSLTNDFGCSGRNGRRTAATDVELPARRFPAGLRRRRRRRRRQRRRGASHLPVRLRRLFPFFLIFLFICLDLLFFLPTQSGPGQPGSGGGSGGRSGGQSRPGTSAAAAATPPPPPPPPPPAPPAAHPGEL